MLSVYGMMRKSCKYCGRTHAIGHICKDKPRYDKPRTKGIDKFRHTRDWLHKRAEIIERDGYRCRLCEEERRPRRYNPGTLSVHHIIPMSEDWSRRLDGDNLITLCSKHHEQAERGIYSKEILFELAERPPPGASRGGEQKGG